MKGKKLIILLMSTLLCSFAAIAQTATVHGVVLDPLNASVPGASVIVKGSMTNGTVTDLDGNFTIKANAGDVLVISCIGYVDNEYLVKGDENNVKIVLNESFESLDELVVVGYGVQKKSVMTSAVSRVASDELDEGHPTNVQNALKGKVSGVVIIAESGQPGADSKIRIRGIGTVNDSDPLYIIDGMPSESGINHLNPSDIESIEILKDAASAAIYGARGANGVVLVTTKEGREGKSTVNYDFSFGIQNPAHKVELLNSEEYQMILNEQAANTGLDPYFTSKITTDTDWQDVLQNKNAQVINHRLSVSGGDDRSNYYVSFGYLNQDGIYASGYSSYERYNFRAKYNNTVYEAKDRNWLNKITLGINVDYSRAKKTGSSIGNDEGGGLIASMNMLPPTEPVYQTNAETLARYELMYPNRVIAPNGQSYNIIEMNEICNPLAAMQASHNEQTIPENFGGNVALGLDILPGLSFKTTFSLGVGVSSTRKIVPVYELNTTTKNTTSYVQDSKSQSSHMQWENVLTYKKDFGKHNIGAMLGTSMSSYTNSWINATDYEIAFTDIEKAFIDSATAPEEQSKVSSNASDHKLASVFARVNYNYNEKYLFEAVVRRDGSSNFPAKNKYAIFPSVSAGWVITKEDFMQSTQNWLNFAKLRLSWGQNGNERIGAFQYTTTMSKGHDAVVDGKVYTGMLPDGYANEHLKWETSEQFDAGLDLRFFDNAATFTVDYFNKVTKDMLLYKAIPMYTSYWGMTMNAGSVKNSGIEFDASYKFRIGDVNFGLSGNASYLKNVVLDQGDNETALNTLGGGMGNHVAWSANGYPYGYFKGLKTEGVFQNQAEINAHATQEGAKPGDLKYVDINNDNIINSDDETMIGDPNPDWTFGFNLTASWKNFDFSAFFQGTAGNDIYKIYRRPNVTLGNYGKEWLNRWHGEGTSNTYPRVVAGETYKVSDFYVEDGSYLRFKICQIGYTLPSSVLKKIGLSSVRFYVQGENLLTFTKYTGYDPEVGTRFGTDAGTYPQARTFTFGASVKF